MYLESSCDGLLDHLEGWLWDHQHTPAVGLRAFGEENDWPVFNILGFPQFIEAFVEASAFFREPEPTGSPEYLKHANGSDTRFARFLVEVHRGIEWGEITLQVGELYRTCLVAQNQVRLTASDVLPCTHDEVSPLVFDEIELSVLVVESGCDFLGCEGRDQEPTVHPLEESLKATDQGRHDQLRA